MKKNKVYAIVDSNYDDYTGVSTVTINTDLGLFVGKARVHEEDAAKASWLFGGDLALNKALRKYFTKKIKEVKKMYREIFDVYLNIICDDTCTETKYIVNKLFELIERGKEYSHIICELEDAFDAMIAKYFNQEEIKEND